MFWDHSYSGIGIQANGHSKEHFGEGSRFWHWALGSSPGAIYLGQAKVKSSPLSGRKKEIQQLASCCCSALCSACQPLAGQHCHKDTHNQTKTQLYVIQQCTLRSCGKDVTRQPAAYFALLSLLVTELPPNPSVQWP